MGQGITPMCLKTDMALFYLIRETVGQKEDGVLRSPKARDLWDCSDLPLEVSRPCRSPVAWSTPGEEGVRGSIPGVRPVSRGSLSTLCANRILRKSISLLQDGRLDMSFFAPDCIHPSQKFHSQLSRALWVNMLEPLGRKTDTLDLTADIPLSCPTQVIREDLLHPSPGTQSSDVASPPSRSSAASSLPILPLTLEADGLWRPEGSQ